MSEPPASRYRVVERKGRLITIDTWSGESVGGIEPVKPGARPVLQRRERIHPLVRLLCAGAADDQGRPILTTAALYDAQGPRDFVLGPRGQRLLIGAAATVVAVVLLTIGIAIAFGMPFLALVLLWPLMHNPTRTKLREWLTPRLDRLSD